MKIGIIIVAFLGMLHTPLSETENFETIYLTTDDGLTVTADLYKIQKENAPIILLFHQAGYSRGAYRSIAPKLNAMGFHCLALDQRSGKAVKEVVNETNQQAVKNGMGTKYADALTDLQAALAYANKNFQGKCLVWGSSYSASLVFRLAADAPDKIDGLLAFSPGEYFTMEGKQIAAFAASVKCPVFVTSAKNEHSRWKDIYEAVASGKAYYLPSSKGYHGSKALWPENQGSDKAWEAVTTFLVQFKK